MLNNFRYDTSGNWYKGNTHVHTTFSDGGKTPDELASLYAAAGYDFLCRADHWVASDVAAEGDDGALLWMDGIELDGRDRAGAYFHAVALGRFEGLSREMGLVAAMEACRAQGGLLILAHPHWTGNTMDDALRHGFDGVEVYNHVCRWLNGKGDGLTHWDRMLEVRPETLGLAVDDAHVRPEHPGWNGGWIAVNASARTRDALSAAIKAGRFYSSQGPEFHSIEYRPAAEGADGARRATVSARTSPVCFARLVGPASAGARMGSFEGETYTEFSLELPEGWATVRLEIEDADGKRAWTNTLFTAE